MRKSLEALMFSRDEDLNSLDAYNQWARMRNAAITALRERIGDAE
jgi:hypothetical protein